MDRRKPCSAAGAAGRGQRLLERSRPTWRPSAAWLPLMGAVADIRPIAGRDYKRTDPVLARALRAGARTGRNHAQPRQGLPATAGRALQHDLPLHRHEERAHLATSPSACGTRRLTGARPSAAARPATTLTQTSASVTPCSISRRPSNSTILMRNVRAGDGSDEPNRFCCLRDRNPTSIPSRLAALAALAYGFRNFACLAPRAGARQ
jgi:hypothetical protein